MKKYNQGYAAKDRADRARRRLTPDGWAKVVLPGIRARAKKRGLEFDLAPEDLRYPEYCPVLGIKLVPGRVEGFNACPSVDRFDNTKGYTKDNIRVISARANSLKKDASIQEMRAILAYMEGVS